MATSGKTSFNVTRDDIITAALRSIGVLGLTQSPTAEDLTFGTLALNLMLKSWQAQGATLWKIDEVKVQLLQGQTVYPLGPTAGMWIGNTITNGGTGYTGAETYSPSVSATVSGYSVVAATLAAATVAGGALTSFPMNIKGTGYDVYGEFGTIPAVTQTAGPGTGAVITPRVLGSVVKRPLRVLNQGNFIREVSTGLDTPITMLSREEYESYGSKNITGVTNSFFYDPQINPNFFLSFAGKNSFAQFGSGKFAPCGALSVYPTPVEDFTKELHLFVQTTIEDVVQPTDNFDLPQEWYMALRYGLARELLVEYGVDEATERRVETRWNENKSLVWSSSVEEASTFFTYDTRGM